MAALSPSSPTGTKPAPVVNSTNARPDEPCNTFLSCKTVLSNEANSVFEAAAANPKSSEHELEMHGPKSSEQEPKMHGLKSSGHEPEKHVPKSPEQEHKIRAPVFDANTPINVRPDMTGRPRRTWRHKYTTPGFTAEKQKLLKDQNSQPAFEFPDCIDKRWGGRSTKKAD